VEVIIVENHIEDVMEEIKVEIKKMEAKLKQLEEKKSTILKRMLNSKN